MPTVIIDGVEYCLATPPGEDDGDDTNKPTTSEKSEEVPVSHCK